MASSLTKRFQAVLLDFALRYEIMTTSRVHEKLDLGAYPCRLDHACDLFDESLDFLASVRVEVVLHEFVLAVIEDDLSDIGRSWYANI